jgi:hypothetical protein
MDWSHDVPWVTALATLLDSVFVSPPHVLIPTVDEKPTLVSCPIVKGPADASVLAETLNEAVNEAEAHVEMSTALDCADVRVWSSEVEVPKASVYP